MIISVLDKSFILPERWEELSEAQAHLVMQTLVSKLADKRLNVLFIVCPDIRPYVKLMELDSLDAILTKAFAFTQLPIVTQLIKTFEHKGKVYHTPTEILDDVEALQYAEAEEAFNNQNLIRMAAHLCRPSGEKYDHDKVPFIESDFATLPAYILYYISIVFISGKNEIHERYESIFQSSKNSKGNSGPAFGWIGTFFAIADSGALGKLQDVIKESIHLICYYLVYKKQQADEAEAKAKSKQ
jgi:hypothetical protein